ncbi:hypothetical protein MOQ_007673 [Trypanosoma cruzi marinkellei]|uniref:Dispersed gene family protein 1 (DGF-1) n=1 Tax=Trypanosoma cruzi marinkellei TaxID=85056 RepID=K2NI58_TRYCR|nr:hypothetical protein MOQ_007673 [Trypanosoma cruzi marinkellei]
MVYSSLTMFRLLTVCISYELLEDVLLSKDELPLLLLGFNCFTTGNAAWGTPVAGNTTPLLYDGPTGTAGGGGVYGGPLSRGSRPPVVGGGACCCDARGTSAGIATGTLGYDDNAGGCPDSDRDTIEGVETLVPSAVDVALILEYGAFVRLIDASFLPSSGWVLECSQAGRGIGVDFATGFEGAGSDCLARFRGTIAGPGGPYFASNISLVIVVAFSADTEPKFSEGEETEGVFNCAFVVMEVWELLTYGGVV